MLFKNSWKHIITGIDGNCMLFDVNIFDHKWNDTGKKATVFDPQYHQAYNFNIYTVEINEVKKRFAAGEFSNCVWGFYLENKL